MNHNERQRRWRLILGNQESDGLEAGQAPLSGNDIKMDETLEALYDAERKGGLGDASPDIARWLGDIRTYFPAPVVRLMQQDALERLSLRQMLFEPELLAEIEPDVQLVANLLSLSKVMPSRTKETARQVVNQVVTQLQKLLQEKTSQAVNGAMHRANRSRRPRHNEIHWHRTIQKNLKHYQPDYKTIIAEQLVGYGRQRAAMRDVILLIDQSGSMATSVVYASIFGAVIATLPALSTSLVVFSTSVADLTPELHDPVELLFGTQLGGGTDIHQALTYAQTLVRRPQETILLLITDLYEGGNAADLIQRAQEIVATGVQLIILLALNDRGTPSFDHHIAAEMGRLGIPVFACTPDLFPDLMATAIREQDITQWATRHDIRWVGGDGEQVGS